MSTPPFTLANPPIVEVVLDIECDFPPGLEIKALEEPSRKQFRDTYPKMRTEFRQQFQIESSPVGQLSHSTRRDVQAYQFLQEDEKQLVQVRAPGYSFNRLAPYSGFDHYVPEIRRTWNLYREIASPMQIRKVRLRYINRIHLPVEEGRVDLDDYFRIGPRLPDELRLRLIGFLNQFEAVEPDSGYLVTAVLTAEQEQHGKLPVIFDNAVAATQAVDPADWEQIEAALQSLRNVKNGVFRNAVSDKCLNLFR